MKIKLLILRSKITNETKVKGMVISAMPVGEYDRRLEILTTDFGRISAFARGSRKPSSPLVACTRVFAFGEFSLYQGRDSFSVNSANIINYFEELSRDFEANCYGSYFLELSRFFTRENLNAEEILKLLYQSLRALSVESLDKRLVKSIYEIKMIEINGIYHEPLNKNLSEPVSFALDFVTTSRIEKLYTFRLTPECLDEFEKVAANMIKGVTHTEFKSLKLLEDIYNQF